MIDRQKIAEFSRTLVAPNFNPNIWQIGLGLDGGSSCGLIYKRVFESCSGNFNYWQVDDKIVWPDTSSSGEWFAVIRGEKPIEDMNLPDLRKHLLQETSEFLHSSSNVEIEDKLWWAALSHVYGGDPLRKRETLAWIILTDLGFKNIPIVQRGCIDYNLIVALRFNGCVYGYKGNKFNLYDETKLRTDCLLAVEEILNLRSDLTVSSLDKILYFLGRKIRHTTSDWEQYFCYRIGCYFY